ncbi:MAG: adenine phosphoribosyltransferase [Dehalococcoidia bacterium]
MSSAEPRLDLRRYIREVPDFPQKGVLFRDITPLLRDPDAYRYVIDEMTRRIGALAPDVIVGIESRGFLFGAPMAYHLGIPFVPVRKAGKLPAERMSVEFSLEYGESQLDIHADALARDQQVIIVDDLLATGGTASAAAKLVELLGAYVKAMAFLVELSFLGGREKLREHTIISLLDYSDGG